MAETNAQPQVLQAQVVQATVVGQPIGQAGYPQPVQAFQGQAMYGQHAPYAPYNAYAAPSPDQSGAQMSWMLYGIGWVLCCCFGPVGPIFWFAVACMHYCKPKEVRQNLPLESQVACVSLGTAIATTVLTVVIIALIITAWASVLSTVDEDGSYTYYSSGSSYSRYR
eukprot:s198_g5.t1